MRKALTITVVTLAVLGSTIMAPPAQPAAGVQGCDGPITNVVGLGPACPVGLMWRVFFDDGSSTITHGFDYVEPTPLAATVTATPSDPVCVANGNYGILAIYAVPSDKTDRYLTLLSTMRDIVREMNGRLNQAATNTGGPRVDYRFVCDAGAVIHIEDKKLSHSSSGDSFSTIVSELDNTYNHARMKYLVFYDDVVLNAQGNAICGTGSSPTDESRSSSNAANGFGAGYGVAYDPFSPGCQAYGLSYGAMHEITHTMGAVHANAPYTSGAGHCSDGWDLMCYRDNGPTQCTSGGNECKWRCTDFSRFDCGSDTYFNTNPPAGSYLANYWNLGDRLNRFFSFAGYTPCDETGIVVLYQDENYGGGCAAFDGDSSDFNGLTFNNGHSLNDGVTSLVVESGYQATLYAANNYGSTARAFTGSVSHVGNDFNDVASSLKITTTGVSCGVSGIVVVYEHLNYGGGCKAFSGGDWTFTDDSFSNGLGLNDAVSSIRVQPGFTATLYHDFGYSGGSVSYSGDNGYVGAYMNDQATSLYLQATSYCSGLVTLYEAINFGGGCKGFSADDPDFGNDVYWNGVSVNRTSSSIVVAPGYIATLDYQPNYQGGYYTHEYGATDAFVGDDGYYSYNDLASSLKIRPAGQACVTTHATFLVVYRDANFQGPCRTFETHLFDAQARVFNSGENMAWKISSVKVRQGFHAEFWTKANWEGTKYDIRGNIAGNGAWNDNVMSIRGICGPNTFTVPVIVETCAQYIPVVWN